MAYVVEELAKLGLDTGIYSSAGLHTCAGKYASLGLEDIDARTYKEWGELSKTTSWMRKCSNDARTTFHGDRHQAYQI